MDFAGISRTHATYSRETYSSGQLHEITPDVASPHFPQALYFEHRFAVDGQTLHVKKNLFFETDPKHNTYMVPIHILKAGAYKLLKTRVHIYIHIYNHIYIYDYIYLYVSITLIFAHI